jgi:hypothetical protein
MSTRSKVTLTMLILHGLLMIVSYLVMKYKLNMDSTFVLTIESISMGVFTSIDEVKDAVYLRFVLCKDFIIRNLKQFAIEVLGGCWLICIKASPAKNLLEAALKELMFLLKVGFWYIKWKLSGY